MEDFLVFKSFNIQSHKGKYSVEFIANGIDILNKEPPENAIFIIDKTIRELYESRISRLLKTEKVIIIEAQEKNKSIENLPAVINRLVSLKVRRDSILIAMGGGIIQDIVCFLSLITLRIIMTIFFLTQRLWKILFMIRCYLKRNTLNLMSLIRGQETS